MDGRVLCWGENADYQCGQPTTPDVLVPTEVPGLHVGAP
jgi:alpha-tubulin suppressor-like RCC1 family protein